MGRRSVARILGCAALMAGTLAIAALPLSGCATTSPRTINAQYADQLDQLRPGVGLARFKELLPKARHFNTMFAGGVRTDVYRLDHSYKPDERPAIQQSLYFFFRDDLLLRWGQGSS